ncbi:MAG TPA: HAD family phosphatase [Gemmataceae bacterium]|nr:HAD family phosphatase [Gemmataceae bacterium]
MKAIVFDFGNVVAFFDHFRTLNKLARYTDLTPEAMYAAIYDSELEDAVESGRLSIREFLERFRELCRLSCDDELLASACADIFWPNEEVCALVPALAGRYRLLLGSNTNALHARHFCRQFEDVLSHFEALVLSCEIGVRKPRAGFFEHCQRLAGCAAEECVFIDDLPANVEGARACGWHGIVYRQGGELRERLAALGIRLPA